MIEEEKNNKLERVSSLTQLELSLRFGLNRLTITRWDTCPMPSRISCYSVK